MFEATTVATTILILNKNKKTSGTILIDAREECEILERQQKGQYGGKSHANRTYTKKYKYFSEENIKKIVDVLNEPKEIKGFSKIATLKELEEREWQLAPSMYLDIEFENPPHREYKDIINDLNYVVSQKNCLKLTINEKVAKEMGIYSVFEESARADSEFDKNNDFYKKISGLDLIKHDYLTFSKKKNEVKFENKSDSEISIVLLSILQAWKQHIMYLNTLENRYLIELRDALLPELMSGELEID